MQVWNARRWLWVYERCVLASDGFVEVEPAWRWRLAVPPHPSMGPACDSCEKPMSYFRGEEPLRNAAVVASRRRVRWLVMW